MSTSYRDLVVWQKAIKLAVAVYDATERFPRSELYGMMSQMRRAVTSIPANIAEGYGRRSARQRYSFLENALGSVYELETHVEVATHLHFLSPGAAASLKHETATIGRGLNGLLAYVAEEARSQPDRHRHSRRAAERTGVAEEQGASPRNRP